MVESVRRECCVEEFVVMRRGERRMGLKRLRSLRLGEEMLCMSGKVRRGSSSSSSSSICGFFFYNV